MKLTNYGYDVMIATLLLALGLLIGGLLVDPVFLKTVLIALAVLLAAFTLYFFRDPERTIPGDPVEHGTVISPADGKVVVVKEIDDDEYLKAPAWQISIFLSPLDVHVNRAPISGEVDYYKYVPGKFVAAFEDKASELNERTHIGIRNERMSLMVKQIAGAIARRIVCHLQPGDVVERGERFGMIKFGSRTDIIVPRRMKVEVALGERVVGGETILCRFLED